LKLLEMYASLIGG